MMKVAAFCRTFSDTYLRQITQLGADCVDFSEISMFPGFQEQGYPDLDMVLKIKRKISSWGLSINRVTLPTISEAFLNEAPGSEKELENTCNCLRVFADAGFPFARQRFAGDVFEGFSVLYKSKHRGGYISRGETQVNLSKEPVPPSKEDLDNWWTKFKAVYSELVPIAEETGIRLAIHPSDTPFPGTPMGGLGYHRIIDAFPSEVVGYLYCVGTRSEEGGQQLVLNELNNYGRNGRLFECHFRNVRGSLATARAFEETLLDDGDMNMFRVLLELDKVGFAGALNPDHIPAIEADDPDTRIIGLSYSIGYIRALLTALVEFKGSRF